MKKVLVIDDDAAILEVMQEALEHFGYEVRVTAQAHAAFSMIDAFKPELVLLDYKLDGANGGEICHQIKTNPWTAHLPVVLVSAYCKSILSLGNCGYDKLLAKPFDLEELLSTVEKFCPDDELPPRIVKNWSKRSRKSRDSSMA